VAPRARVASVRSDRVLADVIAIDVGSNTRL
jgi:hypothetical protein